MPQYRVYWDIKKKENENVVFINRRIWQKESVTSYVKGAPGLNRGENNDLG
jgi:hypothetical protein